jgi:hypothetical protein
METSMTQSFPPGNVEAHIQGEISGQVAIGNNIIQIGAIHGGVVNIALPEQQTRPQPRSTPIFLRPRPFPGLLDREAEVGTATAALQSATPVEFYGQPGLGKTTLMRHLAHHPSVSSFPDGVIYLSARHQPLDDLLQSLFDAFYESDVPFKPTDAQVRHALQHKQALILLDDVDLARDEVETLIDAAPSCTFLLASPERRLWGEGRAVALRGLPSDNALALVERELGRPLTLEEHPAAQALWTALEGHPLRLLQAAAMAREEGRSLTEVARRTQAPSPAEALTAETLNALPKPERQVLAALAVLGDTPFHADRLTALTELADAAPVLETLQRRGLVQAHSPRYSLAGALGDYLQQIWDLTPWAERVLTHFTTWAERHRSAPDHLLEEADAILQVLRWGVGAGRWTEVLRLGQAVEGALALGKRWAAWAQVLQWALQATQALGDRAAEAWALHQLGSRALCLGKAKEARTSLSQALRMREAIGDLAAAAVTRHNLSLLSGAPPAPPRKPPAPKAGPSAAVWLTLATGAVIAASLLVGIGIVIMTPTPTPPPPPPPSTNTPTSTPTPTNTPTVTPSPQPRVDIWLAGGCDRAYEPGYLAQIFFRSSVDSGVSVRLDDQELFGRDVVEGRTYKENWEVTQEPGQHRLSAVLDSGVSNECRFSVQTEWAPPVISEVWIEPMFSEPVCPEDKVWVYVQLSDESGLGRVEIRARYPAGSGDWSPGEMEPLDDQTYQHPLKAHEEPGTEFYIYAEDVDKHSTESGVQVYAVEPCVTILYDFVEQAPAAQWTNVGENLPWNGSTSDQRGFARWQDNVLLEDGGRPERVLETHPQWVDGGMIWGEYKETAELDLQDGDRLALTVGTMSGAQAGDVLFRVWYADCHPMDPDCFGRREVVEIQDDYDSQLVQRVVSLDELVGESGRFWLEVFAGESSTQDWAVWVEARVERP